MASRIKKLGQNTLYVLLGNAGSAIIGMVMLPFYTRILSTSEYGTSDLINTYALILHSFVSCCIADSIFVYPKNEDEDKKTRYFSSGILFACFSFAFFALLFFIISYFDKDIYALESFSKIKWWVLGVTGSIFVKNYIQQFTRSIDKMKVYSIAGVVHAISLAATAFVLLPFWGLNGYLWSLVISNLITASYSLFFSKAYCYFKVASYDRFYLNRLLQYGVPLIPNSLMWWLVNGVNRPFIEASLGLEALGIYAIANKFPALLYTLYSIFNNAWGITVIDEFKKEDFNMFFNKTMNCIFLIILLCGCGITVCSKLIVSIFAASDFYEAWMYMPMLTLSFIFQSMSGMIGGVFMAEKKSKYFFYSSIFGAITSVILTYYGIMWLGLMGAPIAIAGSFLVMTLIRLKFAWRYINMFEYFKYFLAFTIFISFIVVYTLDFSLLISIISFITSSVLLLLIFRDETILIRNKIVSNSKELIQSRK